MRTTVLALALLVHASPLVAYGPCPSTNPIAGSTALKVFAPGRFKWFKAQHGLQSIRNKDIRVLKDSPDAAICAQLNAGFARGFFDRPSTSRTYFEANGYYLAVFVDRRDRETNELWPPQLVVLDKTIGVVAKIVPK